MREEIHCPHCNTLTVIIDDDDTEPTGWSDICDLCGKDMSDQPGLTFTINEVAVAVHHKLGIDASAAESIIEEYITQIEEIDGRPVNRDEISQEDSSSLIESAAHDQRAGDLGTRELETLGDTMRAIRSAEADRDPQIRAALKAGARVKDLVDLTGLTRARIYQIRDAG